MQAQIRIYTINKGELDTFVKHFNEETKPIHDKVGWPVVAFGIYMPLIGALIGLVAAHAIHLSLGGMTLVAVLAASASYIVVPAAMRLSLPQANPAIYVPLSLAVTFPFNLIVGIPLYYAAAQWITAW